MSDSPRASLRPVKNMVRIGIGLATSAALVWLVFRDVEWGRAAGALRGIHWGWFALTQLPLWWVMFVRVVRFRLIIGAVAPVSFRAAFSATQIGFIANLCLPGRMGELVRPLALSRLASIPFAQAVALATVDRLTDLVCLLVCLFVAALWIDGIGTVSIPAETFGTQSAIVFAPDELSRVGTHMGAVLVVFFLGLATAVALRAQVLAILRWALARRAPAVHRFAAGFIESFTGALGAARNPTRMLGAVGLALFLWGSFVYCNAWYFESFRLEYHWSMAFVLQALLMVAISVPGAPGFVGPFHVAVVLSFVIVGVGPDEAKAMAILFHLINMLPVFVLGVVALCLENMSLVELARTSARMGHDDVVVAAMDEGTGVGGVEAG